MTLGEYYRKNIPHVNDSRSKEELIWLLEELYHLEKGSLFLHEDIDIDEEYVNSYWNKLKEIPIQYLFNYQIFLNHRFYVNPDVLIPRMETEELTLLAIKIVKKINAKKILDIGVGCGAIILSILLELPNNLINAYGVDISISALKVAQYNKKQYNLSCNLMKSDVYENIKEDNFDLIISNPPYISKDDFVEERVKKNEPYIALYADNDGLEIYEKIIKDLPYHLKKGGYLLLEIDPNRKDGILNFCKTYLKKDYEVTFLKDISKLERFCQIQLL